MIEQGRVTAVPLPTRDAVEMPSEYQPRRLVRRALPIVALIAVLGLIVVLAPGLDEVRSLLGDGRPGWLAVAVVLEALSCVSYVLMFRPIFCRHMPWRTTWELGWSELGTGSIVPASGIGGLALGAWAESVRSELDRCWDALRRRRAGAPPVDSGDIPDPPNEFEGVESEPPHLERGSPHGDQPAPDPGEPRDIP